MDNPWTKISDAAPYVVPSDLQQIEEHNERVTQWQYQTDVVPQPYIGSPRAKVYLLLLNPGFCCRDVDPKQVSTLASFKKRTLVHDVESEEYPFYPLDPTLQETSTGDWWWKRLRQLSDHVGRVNLAKNLFCVEYVSYHSTKYSGLRVGSSNGPLQSQKYAGYLV